MEKDKQSRKLSAKEASAIKELKQQYRDVQAELGVMLESIAVGASAEVNAATHAAADAVRNAAKAYDKDKKQLDQWKASEVNKIDSKYQNKLDALRQTKKQACDEQEKRIEAAQRAIEADREEQQASVTAEYRVRLSALRSQMDSILYGEDAEKANDTTGDTP